MLEDYRRKRNFKKTPEPGPQRADHDGVLHFVVQKHDASHLHYDFRLENRGVLKSWAIPKGPSVDPHDKRLAMEVEDHPFEYKDFEGIIPEGNYGAGTVMVWDNGEYYIDPNLSKKQNEKKIAEALKKGQLTFYVQGHKLKGLYTLIKLRGRKGNEWLLIKKSDDFANQVFAHENESVATGRTLEEIATQPGQVWTSKKSAGKKKSAAQSASKASSAKSMDLGDAPARAMPSSISPMLATLADQPFDRKGWIFEVKWDGYRILAEVKNHKARLYTRKDQTYTEHFAAVAQELAKLPFNIILDGEVVAVDAHGISRFQLLQNYMSKGQGQLLYYAFDVLYLNGHDLRPLPLFRRKAILAGLRLSSPHVRLSDYIDGKGMAFYKAAKRNGLEGVMAKNLDSPYESGRRSMEWLKVKAIQEQEAVIGGFTAPQGSRKHFGALVLGMYRDRGLHYIGHTGGGFNEQSLKDVYRRLQPLVTQKCPFKVRPKTNTPATWVKPQLLCQVKFQEWTADNHMRQPIFLGLREDKNPQEVHQETAQPSVLGKLKTPLSHLEKVFWPEEGYTKGDMVQYYQQMASYILPYIKGRPHALLRQPDGIKDKGFFQKNLKSKPPEWIQTVTIASESKGRIRYLVARDKESLAYMNNLGCIEINPWNSMAAKPQYPDFLVLDLDPVDIDFNQVIAVAVEARKIFTKAGMPGSCKTSGSRGLHVYVPLGAKYHYDQVKDFARFMCMVIHQQMPEITSLERNPSHRKGRVYLDYLQNHYTATMAAPYSLRPRPGATVSTPLEWKEVKRGLDPRDFTLRSLAQRMKKKGDLWKNVLGKGMDMAKSLKELEKIYQRPAA